MTTTNMDAIAAMLESARVADGKPMTDARLKEVFDLVRPSGNWKDPIRASVPEGVATPDEIRVAVAWFAGGEPMIEPHRGHWYVTGAGYYEWVRA